MSATSGDCFALGDLLPTARLKKEQSGSGLFGKLVESPIVWDYIKETHAVGNSGVPFALVLDTDWWDREIGPEGKQSSFDYLVRHHPHLKASELNKLKPEPARPDLLTCNGPRFTGPVSKLDRNEYYEIKPDSSSGIEAWEGPEGRPDEGKRLKLKRFFRQGELTSYKEGKSYPAALSKTKILALPVNRTFQYLASVFIRNHGIKRVLLYISVRLHKPGLLLYKICIEIETDDRRKQEALAKAAAKHLYAAYVVCHFPDKFAAIEPQLGDHSFKGKSFPRIRCQFTVIPELQSALHSLEQDIAMRGIALPGEQYMICCDEAYYQALVARPPEVQIQKIWEQLQARAETWVTYAGGSVAWSKVKPLVLGVEAHAKYLALMYPGAEDFVNTVLSWVSAHPLLTAAIVVTGFAVTAAVAAYIDAALISAAIIGEATITEASALETVGGLGRIAMSEPVAAPLFGREVAARAGTRLVDMSAKQLAAQLGGPAIAANDNALLANVMARGGLVKAAKDLGTMGVAAATLLMVSTSTAYASDKSPRADGSITSRTLDAATAPIISQHVARLYMVRAPELLTSQHRPPVLGNFVNVRNYAEAERRTEPDFAGAPPPVNARYLGRLNVT